MKSFIRYLYEYQNGKRTRNTGFVKVLEQTDTAEIQIYGRGFPVAGGRTLEIYLFYEEDGKCIGIRMGEILRLITGSHTGRLTVCCMGRMML